MTTQVNSTVLGTLGNLTVTGNLSANTVSAWALGGTLTTASQTNITTVGTLASLIVSGNIVSGNATLLGTTTIQQSIEVLNALTGATGNVTHDFTTGSIWYHSSISSNFTANFTNIPTTNNRTISLVIVLSQGATAYIPTAIQINGASQAVSWFNNQSPIGNASKTDVLSYTMIRIANAWSVLGTVASYG
jgi:hypothetical protein